PSLHIAPASVAITSAFTGPSTTEQISRIVSLKLLPLPSFAISEGLVVTPSRMPSEAASRISLMSAVSRKNFITAPNHPMSRSPDDPIPQRSDPRNADLHHVSRLHRTDARRGTGGDHVPRHERHHLRTIPDDLVQWKDEIGGGAVLLALAIDAGFHGHALPRVGLVADDRPDRAESIEALAAGPLPVFALQVARGHVVQAGVAADVRPHVLVRAHVAAALADHHRQFAFEVHPLGDGRVHHVFLRPDHRR